MPEIVGFVSSIHQDEDDYANILLPPGIDEPDVLMVVVEAVNTSYWHGAYSHGMEPEGWQWLMHSGYCCTSPQGGISVVSRLTTPFDTFIGDGTDTMLWWVNVTSWLRKWIAIYAIRDAGGPIAQGGQGMALLQPSEVMTPPWDVSEPGLSLSGLIFPWFGTFINMPANYALDGNVDVDTIDNPGPGPDYGGYFGYAAHWAHTESHPETKPQWQISGLGSDDGSKAFYSPGYHIIVPPKDKGVCYSSPTYDIGKNVAGPHWQSRCWSQEVISDTWWTSWEMSGYGTLRLTGTNEWTDPEQGGNDISGAEAYQCSWPFAPEGPYNLRHAARIKFKWHPVGTVMGDISSRSIYYRCYNAGDFEGGVTITFPTTEDPYIRLTTGPWATPTNVLIDALPTDTEHILEVDFLTGVVKVRLALATEIDAAPVLAEVPYHVPGGEHDWPPVGYPVMVIGATCSTNDIFDVLDIEVAVD